MSASRPSLLVAGVGNVFLGDDGFGVEVVRRLAEVELPEHVRVADFGIRGVHLAYELCEGYDTAILVDAAPRGEAPGTVSVIEPDLDAVAAEPALMDAHGMEPHAILGLLGTLGGEVGRVLVVGCEPADVSERMELSPPVEAAVDEAVRVVQELVGTTARGRADRWVDQGACSRWMHGKAGEERVVDPTRDEPQRSQAPPGAREPGHLSARPLPRKEG